MMEWYGQLNYPQGRDGVRRLRGHGEPDPRAGADERPAGGFGLHDAFIALGDRLVGILNGIDLEVWDPATDPRSAAHYSADDLSGKATLQGGAAADLRPAEDPARPLIGMAARLVTQKGLDILLDSHALPRDGAQFVFLGAARPATRGRCPASRRESPERVGRASSGSPTGWRHRIMAGADMFLVPSLYEPCGLTQMRAQRYGTIPVARRVGGLADTIEDGVTGFLFDDYTAEALLVGRAAGAIAQFHDREAMVGVHARGDGAGLRAGSARRGRYARRLPRALAGRRRRAEALTMDFVLALHSHLPYVLHHGRWPHGSDWLCEAALDTYLPLLEELDDAGPAKASRRRSPSAFTPVLANQLASPEFAAELDAFFAQRLASCDEARARPPRAGRR